MYFILVGMEIFSLKYFKPVKGVIGFEFQGARTESGSPVRRMLAAWTRLVTVQLMRSGPIQDAFGVRQDRDTDGLEKECARMKGGKKSARFLDSAAGEWCCHLL